jgi:UDP-N-acetylbacillosamine N-acetyltransferase
MDRAAAPGRQQTNLRVRGWPGTAKAIRPRSREGFQLATALHPKAFVAADVSVGQGTLIVARVVVNLTAKVGENVIVNACASVEHECVIEDGVHISVGVHLGGRVLVRRAAVVEIGATVARGISIGAGAIIGAGSVVLCDIPDFVLAYGIPGEGHKKDWD